MPTICIQIQPKKAPGIDMLRVRALAETIAANKEMITRFAVIEGEDDGPYSNLMFETLELNKLWESLWETLYKDERVGSVLSQGLWQCARAAMAGITIVFSITSIL